VLVKAANLERATSDYRRNDHETALWLWSAVESIPKDMYLKKLMEIAAAYSPAMQDNWSVLTYRDRRPHIERSMRHLLDWSDRLELLALQQLMDQQTGIQRKRQNLVPQVHNFSCISVLDLFHSWSCGGHTLRCI
jgi:hypothetical protein